MSIAVAICINVSNGAPNFMLVDDNIWASTWQNTTTNGDFKFVANGTELDEFQRAISATPVDVANSHPAKHTAAPLTALLMVAMELTRQLVNVLRRCRQV